jgi:hypothetical protein
VADYELELGSIRARRSASVRSAVATKARVAGPLSGGVAPARVHAPDELRVQPDAGAEGEADGRSPPEGDAADAPCGDGASGRERVARQAERPRQHTRPAARHEPDPHTGVGPRSAPSLNPPSPEKTTSEPSSTSAASSTA